MAEVAIIPGRRRGRKALAVSAGLLALAGGALAAIGLAYVSFSRDIDRAVASVLSSGGEAAPVVVTAEMIARLPPPVQRYMRFSGVAGKAIPQTVRLTQTGRIRSDADSPWMEFDAVEVYSTSGPAFVWQVWLPSRHRPFALGRDLYLAHAGSILIKFGGVISLADGSGPEIDQGSLMRLLNEMTWFPAAFLGNNVSWRGIDDEHAEVTLTDNGRSVSATMTFGADGRPINFVAERYRTVEGGFELATWSTPFTAFGQFEGVTVPVAGRGVWNLAAGDLEYIELTVTGLEYDP